MKSRLDTSDKHYNDGRKPNMEPSDNKTARTTNVLSPLLGKLADTAVILALFPAILYLWGINYYDGFIDGLNISIDISSFKIPPDELVLGGAQTLIQTLHSLPKVIYDVVIVLTGVALATIIVTEFVVPTIIGFVTISRIHRPNHLQHQIGIRVPRLMKRMYKKLETAFASIKSTCLGFLQKLHKSWEIGRTLTPMDPRLDTFIEGLLGSLPYLSSFALVIIVVITVLFLGLNKSKILGEEMASNQIKNASEVKLVLEVIQGDKEVFKVFKGKVYGRIGDDLILKDTLTPHKFTIIKESSIKKVVECPDTCP
jgi:hypothetical protein